MVRRRLDVLLVERGLAESRAKARAAIEAGGVTVDGATVGKAAAMVDADAALDAVRAHPWVSRAGVKLAHALDAWPVAVMGRVVLDVGASTGGFTAVCLARGAAKVFAVDVGQGQLHPTLRGDARVVDLSQTDARDLTTAAITTPPELVVCDVSFIGLAKALPTALRLAATGADLVVLVKPQFEVGPERVGKGGLVRDPDARQDALDAAQAFLRGAGWRVHATIESPILGGDGNQEFLLWATKPG